MTMSTYQRMRSFIALSGSLVLALAVVSYATHTSGPDSRNVPKFYDVHYHEDGSMGYIQPTNGAPRRVFTMRNPMRKQEGFGQFEDGFIPASEILTANTEMSGRYLVEISRGCSMGMSRRRTTSHPAVWVTCMSRAAKSR